MGGLQFFMQASASPSEVANTIRGAPFCFFLLLAEIIFCSTAFRDKLFGHVSYPLQLFNPFCYFSRITFQLWTERPSHKIF